MYTGDSCVVHYSAQSTFRLYMVGVMRLRCTVSQSQSVGQSVSHSQSQSVTVSRSAQSASRSVSQSVGQSDSQSHYFYPFSHYGDRTRMVHDVKSHFGTDRDRSEYESREFSVASVTFGCFD